jgi:hypothetical protein
MKRYNACRAFRSGLIMALPLGGSSRPSPISHRLSANSTRSTIFPAWTFLVSSRS